MGLDVPDRLRVDARVLQGLGGAALVPACLTIDGGAIELSWVTYCASGTKATKAATSATRLRISFQYQIWSRLATAPSSFSLMAFCSVRAARSFMLRRAKHRPR